VSRFDTPGHVGGRADNRPGPRFFKPGGGMGGGPAGSPAPRVGPQGPRGRMGGTIDPAAVKKIAEQIAKQREQAATARERQIRQWQAQMTRQAVRAGYRIRWK
jgi:hypothetical protein